MPRRRALITQHEVQRAIRGARKEGAHAIEVKPDGSIRIELSPQSTGENPLPGTKPVARKKEIVL